MQAVTSLQMHLPIDRLLNEQKKNWFKHHILLCSRTFFWVFFRRAYESSSNIQILASSNYIAMIILHRDVATIKIISMWSRFCTNWPKRWNLTKLFVLYQTCTLGYAENKTLSISSWMQTKDVKKNWAANQPASNWTDQFWCNIMSSLNRNYDQSRNSNK